MKHADQFVQALMHQLYQYQFVKTKTKLLLIGTIVYQPVANAPIATSNLKSKKKTDLNQYKLLITETNILFSNQNLVQNTNSE